MNRNQESVQNETARDEELAQEICLEMDDISIEAVAPVSDSEDDKQNVTDDDSAAENELQEIQVEGNQTDSTDDEDATVIIIEDPIDSTDNIEAVAQAVAPNSYICDGSSDCCVYLCAVSKFFGILFGSIIVLGGGILLLQRLLY